MTQELGPNQKRWIEALRSGEYRQTTRALCRDGAYCCLGVGCVLIGMKSRPDSIEIDDFDVEVRRFGSETQSAPKKVVSHLALRSNTGADLTGDECLAQLNDEGKTFAEIADLIESNPANWFTEAR